jgi:sulfur carrier protein ThiS
VRIVVTTDERASETILDVPDATSLEQLLETVAPDTRFADLVVRVNRRPATPDRVLRGGDRIHISSTHREAGSE